MDFGGTKDEPAVEEPKVELVFEEPKADAHDNCASTPQTSSLYSKPPTTSVTNLMPPPAWYGEFMTRTENLNPFAVGASSDPLLELCFLLHPPPCGHGLALSRPQGAQDVRVALRKGLDDIISREIESLQFVSILLLFTIGV